MFRTSPYPIFLPARHAPPAVRAGDAAVRGILALAGCLAAPAARIDAILRREKTERIREALSRAHGGRTDGAKELRSIWCARIAREGLHILDAWGLEQAILRRVVIVGDTEWLKGRCVFAVYHSPWGRVLARWLSLQPRAVLFATGRWAARAPGAQLSCSWRGIRKLVEHVRSGGSAAVTCDHFGDNPHAVTASLLGREVRASSGAARMAAAAGVPLVPVAVRYANGRLEVRLGDRIPCGKDETNTAARAVVSHFDAELRADPSSWADVHRYLSRAG